jgi:glycerol-3-phosphate dehydrogenase
MRSFKNMGGSGRLGDPDPDYDVIIIGGGPVGLELILRSAV